jgi:cyclophilin family peptidyl-prolyl cis-trans isomerase
LKVAVSPVASVREQVARGIGRSLAGDSLRTGALAALGPLAVDPMPHVRVNAIRALATYGRDAADRIVRALGDSDPGVRLVAAEALGAVLDSTAATWNTAFAADSSFVVQRAVALGARGHGVAVRAADSWRTSPEWYRRTASVDLDALGPATGALQRLTPWLRDDDGRVRAAAAGAIAVLADSAESRAGARVALTAVLRDSDVGVRAAALQGLSHAANLNDLAAALESYAIAAHDTDIDARLAFWALADSALGHAPTLPESVVTKLAVLVRPSDRLERLVAAHIPRFTAWRDSASVARPLGWYRDRARDAVLRPTPIARIETERGTMELQLSADRAPLTVYNFVSLARRGYFDRQRFHRVVPNFVVQGGDPRGDGNGGPGYAIRDEMNPLRYERGTLGMALSGPHTGGSQFFITHSPQPHLDGGYTAFGQLIAGGEVLDRIVQGDRIVRITVQ